MKWKSKTIFKPEKTITTTKEKKKRKKKSKSVCILITTFLGLKEIEEKRDQ